MSHSAKRVTVLFSILILLVGVFALIAINNTEPEPTPEPAPPQDYTPHYTPQIIAEDDIALQYGRTAVVPILMYHHITEYVQNAWQVTPQTFETHMRVIRDNGFTTVSLRCLVNYVNYGTPLPERPVVITFDDGYLSVYEYAVPILERYGLQAVSFIIGNTVGAFYYKDTEHRITPRFCYEQARSMAHVMDIQSHTYDMHQWAPFETGRARANVLIWDDECEEEYAAVLRADHALISAAVYYEMGWEVFAISFPHGMYDELSHSILESVGITVSLTSNEGPGIITQGVPESLFLLNRTNIDNTKDEERLLEILSPARG